MKTLGGAIALVVALLAGLLIGDRVAAGAPRGCAKQVRDFGYASSAPAQQQLTATSSPCRKSAPWVVTIHGGSWINGTRATIQPAVDMFYRFGWQVFNIEYRRGAEVSWEQQRADVTSALAWVRRNGRAFGLDPHRGTLYGFSAGGHMAAFAGTTAAVSSVVSVSGVLIPSIVTRSGLKDRIEKITGCNVDQATSEREAAAASGAVDSGCAARWDAFEPSAHITSRSAPMYLAQGDVDDVVPPETVNRFAEKLNAAGVKSKVSRVPGLGHNPRTAIDGGPRAYAIRHWMVAQWRRTASR